MTKKHEINKERLAEIRAARKANKDKNADKRLEALELVANGETQRKIAEKTGFHIKYIGQLVVKYLNEGIEAIVGKKREANRRNMSFADEIEFLKQFKEMAEKGQVITAKEIRLAYEEIIGHKCGNGQIYRLLKRHGFRKVRPRGQHPKKASDEEIEASKKLTLG